MFSNYLPDKPSIPEVSETKNGTRNSAFGRDISDLGMNNRSSRFRAVWYGLMPLGLLLLFGTVLVAQLLPPGQVPPGPPPQPGQLGPAPKKPNTVAQPSNGPTETASTERLNADGTRFGTTIKYVLVPTTVLDPDGHGYVNGLDAKDFELLDNDKQQKISAEFTQQSMSVVLVVQANADIEPVLPELRRTGLLVHGLVTGVDSDLAVLAFDHRMQHLQDFTSNPDKIDDAMQKLNSGSTSARLIDAVLEADFMLRHHDPQNTRRRVILLLSRNMDKGSESHLEETVRRMQFDNVIVYCVDISKALTALMKKTPYPAPQNGRIPPEALPNITGNGARSETNVIQQQTGNLANAVPPILHSIHDLFRKSPAEALTFFTGGQTYSFARERALENAITDIGKDLNSQYLLSYSPNNKNEPGFHNIRVLVDRPGLKIRTRPGYWWGGGSEQ